MSGRVLVSIGDPNGIGPELAVAAAARLGGAPVLVGDRHVVQPWADRAGLRIREITTVTPAAPGRLDLVPVSALAPRARIPGAATAESGAATVSYLAAAVDAARTGVGSAIVACPHSETAVNAAGIAFRGYPGLLAELAGVPADRVFLLLVGGGLAVVHATLHERLADAIARLTPELVEAAVHAAVEFLGGAPRIGVCGINPHAGENGLFGDDDRRITVPAVAALRARGVDVVGPLGADLLLAPERRAECDAHVAMYHDQGHIPVKMLAGRTAAAVSVGAGMVFSSVGHGAAFDIAGAGVADPTGLITAIELVSGARTETTR